MRCVECDSLSFKSTHAAGSHDEHCLKDQPASALMGDYIMPPRGYETMLQAITEANVHFIDGRDKVLTSLSFLSSHHTF